MTPPNRRVVLAQYDKAWPRAFLRERNSLFALLGSAARAIHHIGSTSVPGLCAKPVLDILVECPDLASIDSASALLEHGGYEGRGEYGISGRRYFVRQEEPGALSPGTEVGPSNADAHPSEPSARPPGPRMKVHLHCFECGDRRVQQHLRFRDRLRADGELAARYATLRQSLAEEHALDRDAYQAGKASFIDEALGRARG